MIRLTVLAVGKLKEPWLREGCGEYLKRLRLWSRPQVVEVEEYRLPENPSAAQIDACLEKEGERLLERVPKGAAVVALCIEGRQMPSEQLSQWIQRAASAGRGELCFVIGGSYGLSPAVKQAADLRLSISPMTFPHQLARVLVLEQLYRALSIAAHGKYHK